MFSGIIEAKSKIIDIQNQDQSLRIWINKPPVFNDLKIGDSISVNGVCLTVESFDHNKIQFCLGQETLRILGQNLSQWQKHELNLERSLIFGSRVHGHLVTGHVDGLCQITKSVQAGDCWLLSVRVEEKMKKYFWQKGSVCLNGVSLTVNSFEDSIVSVCLIPETISSTNLSAFVTGDLINIEADYLAKAYIHSREQT